MAPDLGSGSSLVGAALFSLIASTLDKSNQGDST